VLALYGAAVAAFVVLHRSFLRSVNLVLFVAASMWFGASLVIDFLPTTDSLFEDGTKLLGIVTWSVLFVRPISVEALVAPIVSVPDHSSDELDELVTPLLLGPRHSSR
jgi:hypothetical protein